MNRPSPVSKTTRISGVVIVIVALIIGYTVRAIHEGNQLTQREKACVSSGQSWVSHHSYGQEVYECKPRQ